MLITFVIAITVITSIYLWFWALTQSQCNKNSDDIKTGFNIVKNEFKVQDGFNKAFMDRLEELEKRIKQLEMYPFNVSPFIHHTLAQIQQKANDNTPASWEEKPKAKTEEAKPELGYTIRVTDNGCTGIRPGTEDETNNNVG